jgi:hypothetical protein
MLTVGNNRAGVEELLGNGLLSCPGCGGRLGGWGHAARRPVFRAGRIPVAVRPRRARCSSCGVTHVLLPAWVLSRRCDSTAVIGDMLARAARGQGFRSIAAASGVPEGTVRSRLRRFRSSAGRVRGLFTGLAGGLAADPVPLEPAGSGLADAVVAVAADCRAVFLEPMRSAATNDQVGALAACSGPRSRCLPPHRPPPACWPPGDGHERAGLSAQPRPIVPIMLGSKALAGAAARPEREGRPPLASGIGE